MWIWEGGTKNGGREPTGRDDECLMQGIHNDNEALIMKRGMNWRNIQEVSTDGDVLGKRETQV